MQECVCEKGLLVMAQETHCCPLISTGEDFGPFAPLVKTQDTPRLPSKDIFHPEVFASSQKQQLFRPCQGLLEAESPFSAL